MPRLPRVTSTQVINALENLGFIQVRQKGSHLMMQKQLSAKEAELKGVTKVACVIPIHNKTLAVGTLKSILNQANISVEAFIQSL